MDAAAFMDGIGLCNGGREVFYKLHSRIAESGFRDAVAAAFRAYDADDSAFADFLVTFAADQGVSAEEANLYLYILLAQRSYSFYREKQIEDSVFFQTMRCFESACVKCYKEKGVYGIVQRTYRAWYRRQLNGTLFHLERLQFEIIPSIYDMELEGYRISKGDTCLYVHIPGGSPLDYEACEVSYARAREFFGKHFDLNPCVFYCGSWLLHPWLTEDLPGSRIHRFQSQFKLAEIVQDEKQVRSWLFNHSEAPAQELPGDTTLRRAAIYRMQNGLPIGYARGYRF